MTLGLQKGVGINYIPKLFKAPPIKNRHLNQLKCYCNNRFSVFYILIINFITCYLQLNFTLLFCKYLLIKYNLQIRSSDNRRFLEIMKGRNLLQQRDLTNYFNDSYFTEEILQKKNSLVSNQQISNNKIQSLLIDNSNQITFLRRNPEDNPNYLSNINRNKSMSRPFDEQLLNNMFETEQVHTQLKGTADFYNQTSVKEIDIVQALGLNDTNLTQIKLNSFEPQLKSQSFQQDQQSTSKVNDLKPDSLILRQQIIQLKASNQQLKRQYTQLQTKFCQMTQYLNDRVITVNSNAQNLLSGINKPANFEVARSAAQDSNIVSCLKQKLTKSLNLISCLQQQTRFLHQVKEELSQKLNGCCKSLQKFSATIKALQAQKKQLRLQIDQHKDYNKQNIKKILKMENRLHILKDTHPQQFNSSQNQDEPYYHSNDRDGSTRIDTVSWQMLQLQMRRVKQKNRRYALKIRRQKQQKQQLAKYLIAVVGANNKQIIPDSIKSDKQKYCNRAPQIRAKVQQKYYN